MINWKDRNEIVKFLKFALLGCFNTLITAVVIWVLMGLFSYDYIVANVWGYAAGIVNSFVWSKLWVFKANHSNRIWREMLLFGVACLVAYGVQFACLLVMVKCISINEYMAQFLGIFVYGVINFIINRVFTFRES